MKITRTLMHNSSTIATFSSLFVLILMFALSPRCDAQTPAQADSPAAVARLHEPAADGATDVAPSRITTVPESSLEIAKELAAMKARIEQLEGELKIRMAAEASSAPPAPTGVAVALPPAVPAEAMASRSSSVLHIIERLCGRRVR